jgi:hypothetical protein
VGGADGAGGKPKNPSEDADADAPTGGRFRYKDWWQSNDYWLETKMGSSSRELTPHPYKIISESSYLYCRLGE